MDLLNLTSQGGQDCFKSTMTDRWSGRNAKIKELISDSSNPSQNITEFKGFGNRPFYFNGSKHQHCENHGAHSQHVFCRVFFLTQVSAFSATPAGRMLLQLNVAIFYFHNEEF